MTWQMCNWRLVKSSSSVDIDSVDHIVRGFRTINSVRCSVLASGGEQEAAVGGKRQAAKEGVQSLVEIYVRILDTNASTKVWIRRIFHWSNGW